MAHKTAIRSVYAIAMLLVVSSRIIGGSRPGRCELTEKEAVAPSKANARPR